MEIDPRCDIDRGCSRWAWHQARHHRARFFASVVLVGVVFAVVEGYLTMPDRPTHGQIIVHSLLGLLIAVVVVVIVTYLACLFRAPYQQRNELRRLASQPESRPTAHREFLDASVANPDWSGSLKEVTIGSDGTAHYIMADPTVSPAIEVGGSLDPLLPPGEPGGTSDPVQSQAASGQPPLESR